MKTAMLERLNENFSLRTFLIAFSGLFILMMAAISLTLFTGAAPIVSIETIVPITSEKTVPVKTGDLNQLDLKPAPKKIEDAIDGLYEKTAYGLAPVTRSSDGMTPFRAYAAEFVKPPSSQGLIALVMMDFGTSQKLSISAIEALPPGVSFALSPYAKETQKLAGDARRKNYEVWLSIPLQAKDYPAHDTGPYTLLAQLNGEENDKRLLQSLASVTGYTGVILSSGNAFTNSVNILQKVVSDITARGLGLVQSDPDDKFVSSLASENKTIFGQNVLTIDQVTSAKDLLAKLTELEAKAVQNKNIIVFFKPYPVTVKVIHDWSKTLGNQGLHLAPLSAVINSSQ